MKRPRVSTLFLKAVLVLFGVAVLALCVFGFPSMWSGAAVEFPELTSTLYPALVGIFATAIPFFIALQQAFRLLQNIDRQNAFSVESVNALRNIKFCAIAMCVGYAAIIPFMFALAEFDDAPGAVLIGLVITCFPLIIATFAALLQKLIQSAADLKSENDLTV